MMLQEMADNIRSVTGMASAFPLSPHKVRIVENYLLAKSVMKFLTFMSKLVL